MSLRQSDGLRNFVLDTGPYKRALGGGELRYYSTVQPANANMAPTGVLLCTFTLASGARTKEVQAIGVVTLAQTGAGTGTVDTFTVNAIEIMGGAVASLATVDLTAAAVCSKINNNQKNAQFIASSVAGVITIKGIPGLGALLNSKALTCGVTAGTGTLSSAITSTTFGSGTGGGTAGVDSVNGLHFGDGAAGTLVKDPVEVWTGVGVADGTVGWFRFVGAVNDADALDAAETVLRLDGNVATSGANLNVTNTTIATGATQTQATFSPGEPAA